MKRGTNMLNDVKPCLWVLALALVLSLAALQGEASAECRITSGDAESVTYSQGQLKDDICDTHGNKPVTVEEFNVCLSGESNCVGDSPNSYIMVRTVMTPSAQLTADAQILAGPGYVSHMICTGDASAAAGGTITVYDSLTETGTALFILDITASSDYHQPMVLPILANAATGIYVGYATVSDVKCTVFYK